MYCVSVGLNGSSDDLQQSRSDNHEQEETNYNRADSEGALFLLHYIYTMIRTIINDTMRTSASKLTVPTETFPLFSIFLWNFSLFFRNLRT
jgi:hypothetical protein